MSGEKFFDENTKWLFYCIGISIPHMRDGLIMVNFIILCIFKSAIGSRQSAKNNCRLLTFYKTRKIKSFLINLQSYVLLFSISILFVSAQDFKGGIIAGMSTSQIRGDAYMGFNKVGFVFGGFANIDLTKQLKIQYEIIYIGKGSKKLVNPDKGLTDFRLIKLDYVEIPVVLKIRHKKPKKTIHKNLTYEAGLSYGVLISSKEMDESGETTIIGPFHKSEFAFQLGLNYALTEKTSINVRYSRSILPITGKAVVIHKRLYSGASNHIICLSLRYQFLR